MAFVMDGTCAKRDDASIGEVMDNCWFATNVNIFRRNANLWQHSSFFHIKHLDVIYFIKQMDVFFIADIQTWDCLATFGGSMWEIQNAIEACPCGIEGVHLSMNEGVRPACCIFVLN